MAIPAPIEASEKMIVEATAPAFPPLFLPSSLGKKAFFGRFLGLQPAHYQPKAF